MALAKSLAFAELQLPDVWRSEDLARQEAIVPTGHAELDAQLPGGGWPLGSLIEVLQPRAEQHVWALLLPALVQVMQQQRGPLALVGAPFLPFGPSLQAQGLDAARLLRVQVDKPASCLWATEQALRCADVAAVLAWLPQAKSAELRRLHIAAQQQTRFLVALRGLNAANEASPARLRLQVQGQEAMEVQILKRRGPPLLQPLVLPAYPQRMAHLLQARKAKPDAVPAPLRSRSHVLDRTAAHA